MFKMVDGTGIIGVDMVCPLGGAVSPPQPPNYDNIEMEGIGSLTLPNSLKAPLDRLELTGNSTQGENPAPDNPQEIKSAGRKSKNLFNIADLRVGQVQKDGTINEKQIYYRTVILDVPQDGKYRITFNSNDDYTMLYFTEAYANGAYSQPYLRVHAGNPNYYITLAKGKNILSFSTHTASGNIAFTTDHNIMIAAESETLDYEPYGYFFDVKVTGKNLLNLQKEPDVKGTYQGWKVGDGKKTIVLSIKDKGNNVDITKCSIGVSGNGINPNDGLGWIVQDGTILRSEIKTTNPYVTIYPPNETAVQKFLDRFEIQVEYGTTATPYEPYAEQFMQIVLNEPLRGIGEYKDVLTKDGVVRKIHEQTLKKEQISMNEYNWDTKYFRLYVNPDKKIDSSINIHELFSNMFKKFVIYKNNPNVYWIISEEEIRSIGITEADSLQVAYEKIKDFVTTNDIVIQYPIVETTLEPLPESVPAQLQALHTENGTTHVFVDSGEIPCGIKLTYRKEK